MLFVKFTIALLLCRFVSQFSTEFNRSKTSTRQGFPPFAQGWVFPWKTLTPQEQFFSLTRILHNSKSKIKTDYKADSSLQSILFRNGRNRHIFLVGEAKSGEAARARGLGEPLRCRGPLGCSK